jgi:hypothetical protein
MTTQPYLTYICIDDTDELGGEISTGEIADRLRDYVEAQFSPCTLVTRHQLFLDDAIPYTSHNSSMCFTTHMNVEQKEMFIHYAIPYLESICAPSSQPGLCVGFENTIQNKQALIQFGEDAKCKVLTKEAAYAMAQHQNLHLSEHKNGGQGVIGALAGVALRLQGNDGRVKGKLKIAEKRLSVAQLLENYSDIHSVRLTSLEPVPMEANIQVDSALKMVWIEHNPVLLVAPIGEAAYRPLTIEELRNY